LLKLAGVTRADRLRSEPPSVNTQRRKHDIAPEYVNVSALCGELHRMITDPEGRGAAPLGSLLREYRSQVNFLATLVTLLERLEANEPVPVPRTRWDEL